ncbi:unnamed protein product [Closterium sp. NIES-53]
MSLTLAATAFSTHLAFPSAPSTHSLHPLLTDSHRGDIHLSTCRHPTVTHRGNTSLSTAPRPLLVAPKASPTASASPIRSPPFTRFVHSLPTLLAAATAAAANTACAAWQSPHSSRRLPRRLWLLPFFSLYFSSILSLYSSTPHPSPVVLPRHRWPHQHRMADRILQEPVASLLVAEPAPLVAEHSKSPSSLAQSASY